MNTFKTKSNSEIKDTIELREWVAKVKSATDEAIEQFGRYTFNDKGPHEVMDVGIFANDLRELDATNSGLRLESLYLSGKIYARVAESILGMLDDSPEVWYNECCNACPSVG